MTLTEVRKPRAARRGDAAEAAAGRTISEAARRFSRRANRARLNESTTKSTYRRSAAAPAQTRANLYHASQRYEAWDGRVRCGPTGSRAGTGPSLGTEAIAVGHVAVLPRRAVVAIGRRPRCSARAPFSNPSFERGVHYRQPPPTASVRAPLARPKTVHDTPKYGAERRVHHVSPGSAASKL